MNNNKASLLSNMELNNHGLLHWIWIPSLVQI